MTRRVLQGEIRGFGSLVSGPGVRELVIEVTGRAPVWSATRKGWSVQEKTLRDVVAAAEIRNYDIVITGRRAAAVTPLTPAAEQHCSPAPPVESFLW